MVLWINKTKTCESITTTKIWLRKINYKILVKQGDNIEIINDVSTISRVFYYKGDSNILIMFILLCVILSCVSETSILYISEIPLRHGSMKIVSKILTERLGFRNSLVN